MVTVPIWCSGCNQQGDAYVDNYEDTFFVICNNCQYETSQVWCPKCEMGGEFVIEISKKPKTWNCPNCRSKYELPSDFYGNPVKLSVQRKIEKNTEDYDPRNLIRLTFIGIMIGLVSLTAVKSIFGAITIWVGIAAFTVYAFYLNNKMKR